MSDYNTNKLNNPDQSTENNYVPNNSEPEARYGMAFLAGLGASVIVAAILATIGIWLEAEYWYALIIGAALVGGAIRSFVPSHSVGGAILGGILCPATYFIYQFIMAIFGYSYEGDGESTFWWMLGISAVVGLYLGYHKDDD